MLASYLGIRAGFQYAHLDEALSLVVSEDATPCQELRERGWQPPVQYR